MGLLRAREEKGWAQLELADRVGTTDGKLGHGCFQL